MLTERDMATIREAREKGWSYSRIARVVGPHSTTIARFCCAKGIAIVTSSKMAAYAQRRTDQAASKTAICKWCGKEYRPRSDARSPTCSKVCSGAWRSYQNKGSVFSVIARACADCGVRIGPRFQRCEKCTREYLLQWGRENSLRLAIEQDKRDRSPRQCKECGETFVSEYGDKKRVFCSKGCCTTHWRRVSRAARKAKYWGGLTGPVDPLAILERDGWRCQLCGCKTPKSKRGTYESNAPEIDHIVPLVKGGSHLDYNLQCTCRRCNASKGARAIGQLRLAI